MDLKRLSLDAHRLLPLAEKVLERYPFEVKEIEHLATHSNVLYRVLTGDGRQLVLRVGSPHVNTRQNIEYEVAWLAALNKETDLDLVAPVPTGYGALIVEMAAPEEVLKRSCVLFSWVPGVPLADGSGTFGYRLLGRVSASLHLHGYGWRPSNPEGMRQWNRVFYYDPGLDPVIIEDERYDHLFTRAIRSRLRQAQAIAEDVITTEWASNLPQVVHGDLHEWNVHVVSSRLYAFDFEDVMVATRAQDVSVSLYSSRSSVRRTEIQAAFRKGYEEVAPWPIVDDRQLDGLHAARQIMLMNYAARTLPLGEAQEYFAQVMPWMEEFLLRYT
jgi:Ser/Thr protein kinase RdoA (MazF antagonist)